MQAIYSVAESQVEKLYKSCKNFTIPCSLHERITHYFMLTCSVFRFTLLSFANPVSVPSRLANIRRFLVLTALTSVVSISFMASSRDFVSMMGITTEEGREG